MNAYFSKMKRLANSLAIVRKLVELNYLITYALTGLNSQDYKSLAIILVAKGENMALDDLCVMLLSHEMRIEQKKGKINVDVVHNLSTKIAEKNQNFSRNRPNNSDFSRGNGVFGSNIPNNPGQHGSITNYELNIICQICFIPGPSINKCKNRYLRKALAEEI